MQHNNSQQTAMKYETIVREDGRIELVVPFTPGAQVVVFVIADATELFYRSCCSRRAQSRLLG